jgi:hypothetical protein
MPLRKLLRVSLLLILLILVRFNCWVLRQTGRKIGRAPSGAVWRFGFLVEANLLESFGFDGQKLSSNHGILGRPLTNL